MSSHLAQAVLSPSLLNCGARLLQAALSARRQVLEARISRCIRWVITVVSRWCYHLVLISCSQHACRIVLLEDGGSVFDNYFLFNLYNPH